MSDRVEGFIEHLGRLARPETGDTGAMAALRRSLAFEPGTYAKSFPYVEPFVTGDGWSRKALYLTAGLFAEHQKHQPGRPFARVLAEVKQARGSESLEQRFLALLDADEDQIAYRLRQNVRLASEHPFDWVHFTKDLLYWFHPDRFVQVNWARDYFGGLKEEEKEEV
ncbi:MAG TPA: type I-E CRISPR-associated protein Cse2/CasB [Oceanithermus sp.]|nr:type I-E CRISPR-associated protein Cse2/CasB [Oceanithermus sp.]